MTRAPLTPEQRAEIRACAEAATRGPWKVGEIARTNRAYIARMDPQTTIALLDALDEAEQWQRDMVAKAADDSLEGYRELGGKCATLERRLDEARERCELLGDELRDIRKEAGFPDGTNDDWTTFAPVRVLKAERDEARAEAERLRLNSKIEQDATNCHMEATAKYQRRESELVGHLRTLIGEIDEWESAVAKIIERPPDCPWKSLEKARAALGGDA